MTTITIRAVAERREGGFDALVTFEGGGEHAVLVSDPVAARPGDEALLSWYFEEHLRFPFLDKDLEGKAVDCLCTYGQELFSQVFGEPTRCHYEYRRRRDESFDGCCVEIVGSPAFHRLHWEALHDPDMTEPLAVRVPVVRRLGLLEAGFDLPTDRTTLNILAVTARPQGAMDVGHRTISRPLLDAVRRARLPVTVDLVRPGTWASLRQHLRTATSRHGSGWYQIVHFDLHGAVGPLDQPDKTGWAPMGSYLFAPGRAPQGDAAVLFFETALDGVADPVGAVAVAELLAEHRVPIAVLNACQSASPAGPGAGTEANLAARLVEAGVAVTVGMAYSVTVSAAQAMMPVLYEHLVGGEDLVAAMHHARRRLFDDRTRRAHFGHDLDLDDWVLPVVFWQRPVRSKLRPMDPAEAAAFYDRQAAVAVEPRPDYGFVGRDLDIQAIERRLLVTDDANELLVQGMAGAGKTTLLAHLAWWWRRTGLVDHVFSFTFESQAWTAGQLVHAIGNAVLDDAELAQLASLPDEASSERVAAALRRERHLLVIDNAESITGQPAAIPHTLDGTEQQRLRRFLASLRGGRTLVLIGSRAAEEWLAPDTFGPNVHELAGLDPQAVSVMVDRALHVHGGRHYLEDTVERTSLEDLMHLVDGYPLALTVLLPRLAGTPPSAMVAALRHGDPTGDPTGMLQRSIEYSHSRLDPELQDAIALLAPFSEVVPTTVLAYYQYLVTAEAGPAAGRLDIGKALEEAVATGLATADPELPDHLRLQPILPYFLRLRLTDRPDLAQAIARAHFALYSELSDTIYDQLFHTSPEERASGLTQARVEVGNLMAALDHGLATNASIARLVWVLDKHLNESAQPQVRGELLDRVLATVGEPTDVTQRDQLAVLHHLAGNAARDLRRFDQALAHYRTEIELREQIGDRRGAGATHHQLGLVAYQERHLDEAEEHFRRGLATYEAFGERRQAAGSHHQLGLVAQDRRRFTEAEEHYRTALAIYQDLGKRLESAGVFHQLGVVASAVTHYDEAEEHYQAALALFEEFGERGQAADTLHNLGTVDQSQGRLDDAEEHYRAALDIRLQLDDQPGSAITYHQLGTVAMIQDRLEEAERYLRKALDIRHAANDRHATASTYIDLGHVASRQHCYDDAERLMTAALEIYRELDDLHGVATVCASLADAALLWVASAVRHAELSEIDRRVSEAESLYHEARDLFGRTADPGRVEYCNEILEHLRGFSRKGPRPPGGSR